MNAENLQYFKQLLLEKRKELIEKINLIKTEDEKLSQKEADGDNSSYPNHLADQGSDNTAQELNYFHAHRDSHFLYQINEALEKIEKGKYGSCETCGQLINNNRLEIVPFARLCIQCKYKEEQTNIKTNSLIDNDPNLLEETYENTH